MEEAEGARGLVGLEGMAAIYDGPVMTETYFAALVKKLLLELQSRSAGYPLRTS